MKRIWSPRRARAFLQKEADERAKYPGLSDTSLARLASLHDLDAAKSRVGVVVVWAVLWITGDT